MPELFIREDFERHRQSRDDADMSFWFMVQCGNEGFHPQRQLDDQLRIVN
jgi:hypothetical protein